MLRLLDFYQFWHLGTYTCNLSIPGNPSKGGLPSLSNFRQVAKISWHAANGTPPDRQRSTSLAYTENNLNQCWANPNPDLDLNPDLASFAKSGGFGFELF